MTGEAEAPTARIRRRGEAHAASRPERWRRLGFDLPLGRQTLPRVSIILATHRVEAIEEYRRNVLAQDYPNLEVIVVLNNDAYEEAAVREKFGALPHFQLLRLPASRNLGSCINLGVAHAGGDYVAKMDDDDFYAPSYISDLLLSALESDADIVGKKATFFLFEDGQEYCFRHPGLHHRWLWPTCDQAFRTSSAKLAGATLFAKRNVIRRFPFDESAPHGTDVLFQAKCRSAGMTIYASDEFNFCYFRRSDSAGHMWRTRKAKILQDGLLLAPFDRSQLCV
jgi:glycosyltransferase involved in cell wall biosynthesis